MAESFLDTNILIYLLAPRDPRMPTARRLVDEGGVTSIQVLNETVRVMRRKLHLDWPVVDGFLGLYQQRLRVTVPTLQTQLRAVEIAKRSGFDIHDSMLLATALDAGCTRFLTEDLHHGQVIDGQLAIENPFLTATPTP